LHRIYGGQIENAADTNWSAKRIKRIKLDEPSLSYLKWLKLPEACRYARMSKNTLKKYIQLGRFSGERLESGQWRINRESIDDYFQRSDEKALEICRKLGL